MQSIDTETESMLLKLFILILYKYVISNYEMPSVRNYFIKREREREKMDIYRRFVIANLNVSTDTCIVTN